MPCPSSALLWSQKKPNREVPMVEDGAGNITELDLQRAPTGTRAARRLVNALVGIPDDRAERYLEIKGRLDLREKPAAAKLAKFIIGAANRNPDTAARHFSGYGVMVIGISKGRVEGVPFVDDQQLEPMVRRYLGVDGPHWDTHWIDHSDTADKVLLVVVDPPKQGDPIYYARENGDDITSGRIYIRVPGETRQANADELDMLRRREKASAHSVKLDVSIEGKSVPVRLDVASTFDEYAEATQRGLLDALPEPEPAPDDDELSNHDPGPRPLAGTSSSVQTFASWQEQLRAHTQGAMGHISHLDQMASAMGGPIGFPRHGTEPETRSEEQYRREVEEWSREFRNSWPAALDLMAAYHLDLIEVRLVNRSEVDLERVKVDIHLEGPVRAVQWREQPSRFGSHHFKLPATPRKWGPVQRDHLSSIYAQQPYWKPVPERTDEPTMTWRNSGSVDLTLKLDALPPRHTHVDTSRRIVLILPAGHAGPVRGTWHATARGHDAVFEGDFLVETAQERDLTIPFRRFFHLDD